MNQSRPLAAAEAIDRFERAVAGELPLAQEVSQLLGRHARGDVAQVVDRAAALVQRLHRVLGEVADAQVRVAAALAAEQGAGRAFEVEQGLVGLHPFAIAHLPMHRDTRVQLAEHRIHPGCTSDDRRFASDDGGFGQAFGRDQLRGDVAAADVLQQRAAHVGFDFGGQVGEA